MGKIKLSLYLLLSFFLWAIVFADLQVRKDIVDSVAVIKKVVFTEDWMTNGDSWVVIDWWSWAIATSWDVSVWWKLCLWNKCVTDLSEWWWWESLWTTWNNWINYISGNVWIGTTAPTDSLDVKWWIKSSEWWTYSWWAVKFKYNSINSSSSWVVYIWDQNWNVTNSHWVAAWKVIANSELWYKWRSQWTSSVQTWTWWTANSYCIWVACTAFCLDSSRKIKWMKWLDQTDKYYNECFTNEWWVEIKVITHYW